MPQPASFEGSLQVFRFSEAFLTLSEISPIVESVQEPCRHESQDKGCNAYDSCVVQDDRFCVISWLMLSVRNYRTQNQEDINRNKQEELEMHTHLQGYALVGTTETW